MAEYKQGDPTGGGGAPGFVPAYVKLRIADAESGDTSTPGFEANAPSQFVSASEDSAGVTVTVRNRTASVDQPSEAMGWSIDPANIIAGYDPTDLNRMLLFRITPVTPFADGSTASIHIGLSDNAGVPTAANARSLGIGFQAGASLPRFQLHRRTTELGFSNFPDDTSIYAMLQTTIDEMGTLIGWAVDGSGNNVVVPVGISLSDNGALSGSRFIYISAGVENTADDTDSTGKYEIEVAWVQWLPAGSAP